MQNRIEKQILIDAPVARVWEALTDARQFGAWFLVKMDGAFIAGKPASGQITYPGYEHLRMTIVVDAITPMTSFSFFWHPYATNPNVDYERETPTLVEFTLERVTGGTLLKVTESGFENIPAERRAEAFLRNDGGWEQQMKNILAYVSKTS
jgi:uncharacterized protein YndB with AHSA1/START domain